MVGNLDGQVAIVTGGARGIGLGAARKLASAGAKVEIWDLDPEAAASAEGFRAASLVRVDVTQEDQVAAAMDAALERFGRLDIFVNNAGITGPVANVENYELATWRRVVEIDLTSVFLCCRAAILPMKARGYGRIVNVASIAGKEGVPGIAAYSAAKAGVIGLTKALARELIETGITVNAIAPAMVETELLQQMTPDLVAASKAKIPMKRFITVEELATLIAFAASPECSFSSGFVFDATGGRATY